LDSASKRSSRKQPSRRVLQNHGAAKTLSFQMYTCQCQFTYSTSTRPASLLSASKNAEIATRCGSALLPSRPRHLLQTPRLKSVNIREIREVFKLESITKLDLVSESHNTSKSVHIRTQRRLHFESARWTSSCWSSLRHSLLLDRRESILPRGEVHSENSRRRALVALDLEEGSSGVLQQ